MADISRRSTVSSLIRSFAPRGRISFRTPPRAGMNALLARDQNRRFS